MLFIYIFFNYFEYWCGVFHMLCMQKKSARGCQLHNSLVVWTCQRGKTARQVIWTISPLFSVFWQVLNSLSLSVCVSIHTLFSFLCNCSFICACHRVFDDCLTDDGKVSWVDFYWQLLAIYIYMCVQYLTYSIWKKFHECWTVQSAKWTLVSCAIPSWMN